MYLKSYSEKVNAETNLLMCLLQIVNNYWTFS